MIRSYSDIRVSADTGVTGVCSSTSYRQDPTFILSALGMAESAGGVSILLSTLSRFNKNKLFITKPILIFFSVNIISLIRLYKEVKYFLSIIFISPRFN
jgi:hypothetical protein